VVEVTISNKAGDGVGLVFRVVDSTNLYRLRCGRSGGGMDIQKVDGGGESIVGTEWVGTIATGDKVKVVLNGTTIEGWHFTSGAWNLRTSGTDAFNQTATKHGLFAQFADGARFEDFSISEVP
jgi:hypothetical protein